MTIAADKKQIKISGIASKVERQKVFIAACKKQGLSSKDSVERASVFPIGEKSCVLKWPKL